MKYKFRVTLTENSRISFLDFDNIPFGKVFTDHMFSADYIDGKWTNMEIKPLDNLSIHPGNLAAGIRLMNKKGLALLRRHAVRRCRQVEEGVRLRGVGARGIDAANALARFWSSSIRRWLRMAEGS